MRRPHRTIETFDISLMAVVTKAMGAFLVLMLLLLPYYTPEPREDTAAELLRQLKELSARIDDVSKRLGDPNKGIDSLRTDLGKIATDASLKTEVLAKLEGLINKAFSEVKRLEAEVTEFRQKIQRLESENNRLMSENQTLKDENQQLKRRIRELEVELERLRQLKNADQRAVYVGGVARNCDDVNFRGLILEIGSEKNYTSSITNEKIEPQYLIIRPWTAQHGGEISHFFQEGSDAVPIADRGPFRGFQYEFNQFLIVDADVGTGEFVIIFKKRAPGRTFKRKGEVHELVTVSLADCDVDFSATALVSGVASSDLPKRVIMSADARGGLAWAFTSNEKGIRFRAPTDKEQAWFDGLFAKTLDAQFQTPEGKLLLEEEQKNESPPDSSPADPEDDGNARPEKAEELIKAFKERRGQRQ